jgi:dTDP-4-dehydrorhamnose 3,5-epimerase
VRERTTRLSNVVLPSLKIIELPLAGLKLIEREVKEDERGSFSRLFSIDELKSIGWSASIAQVNHTLTRLRGTIRGLHYQLFPFSDAKIVSCIRGEVWDVAVDLRPGSPTFLQSHGQLLSPKNRYAMLIPIGFAHGFQTLVENSELIYFHSREYVPTADRGLRYNDPVLKISWPCAVTLVSKRDQTHPLLTSSYPGVNLE